MRRARAGSTEPVRCGTVSVPEDRSKPDGRRIDLRVVVIPAVKPDPAMAPLYDLAGGPGLAATGGADFYLTVGQGYRQARDIVLVDQRGTGASAPLACPELAGTGTTYPDAAVRACRERLATQADLSRYTTADTVADLQAVRAALTAKDDSRLSPDELKEVLLQNAIYAGVPAANTAFNLAQGILREVAGEIGYVLEKIKDQKF